MGAIWPGSVQATAEHGENCPDDKLSAEAKRLGMTIITRDRDQEGAAKLPGPPPIEAIARGHYRAVSRLVAQLENDSFS